MGRSHSTRRRTRSAPARYSSARTSLARGRPLHEIGGAHAVDLQRVEGVAWPGDEPGLDCGGPEAVGGTGEPDTGVGGDEARVETAHEHAHLRSHEVGQRARPVGDDPELVADQLDVVQLEPGAHDDVGERVASPVGEEAPGDDVTGDEPLFVALDDAQHDGRADRERALQVHERERQVGSGDVQIGVAGPRRPQAGRPEREGHDVGAHAQRRRRGGAARSSMACAASRATTGVPPASRSGR